MKFKFGEIETHSLYKKLCKREEEGGCGVVGFASTIPVGGKHIITPSVQMRNRGNGKGGGIAVVGFESGSFGFNKEELESNYMLHVAYLDPSAQKEVEKDYIEPVFNVYHRQKIETLDDYRKVGLEVKPPDVYRYLFRVKEEILDNYWKEVKSFENVSERVEDDIVYYNSFAINKEFYASLGADGQRAFVLSHGKNLMILKVVGYAEQVAQYYGLEDVRAHIWVAHQRYPTKGKVWHPGGAHPFGAMHEALIHNGDFANYHSITEYLWQRGRYPLFLTDTEAAALVFDLLNREYKYPLEYLIEALAPTSELDFKMLSEDKQKKYKIVQESHIHSSPDGPWFFIVAKNDPCKDLLQLIGITDTSMLRPQVFAVQKGEVGIGLIASEKQAIDATLESLSEEDERFCPIADKYWNARGGSHSDGGAFIFTLKDAGEQKKLIVTDKFGREISFIQKERVKIDDSIELKVKEDVLEKVEKLVRKGAQSTFLHLVEIVNLSNESEMYDTFAALVKKGKESDDKFEKVVEALTLFNDRRFETGKWKRSSLLHLCSKSLVELFNSLPSVKKKKGCFLRVDWKTRNDLCEFESDKQTLVIDAKEFPPEGFDCDAMLLVKAHELGCKQFIVYNCRGQRFIGSGLGLNSKGVRIDIYGSSGDYIASSMDGAELYVHGNAQDQLGQIMKSGKLVIYGDVGQTFLYGAKGGEVYVMGNAAGRPLINSVGSPKVIINGTCLDYLAESFMAGDPLNDGGFAIINGMDFDEDGKLIEQSTPYPGGNLFSLASGGAIYIRDPHKKLTSHQLNGGKFVNLSRDDWEIMLPYLRENEKLFGIPVDELLKVDGKKCPPTNVYRKVVPVKTVVLTTTSTDLEE